MVSTTEDGDIRDEVNRKQTRSIYQNKHNVGDVFAIFTQKSVNTEFYSSSIVTVVAKHLNSTLNGKLVKNRYM